ncbi:MULTISPECIES: hypothetical protein [unclassified Pseudodesulfovibrio]|uniref:hypothetical protein n=1 Tax=unclassified Pseudodesulfovibrio TaxID=2661612 RepID=UPI000FEB8A73|nr:MULTISPECIES: hypothetical protein [unclassified Pseudodesulfovibrio]MCJ2164679.1 hypothetical protein [Pseudodesulfovibrio sp. S3-i]
MGYQAAMLKAQGFLIVSMFQTSAGGLPLTLARHSVDSFGGAVIDFKPVGTLPGGAFRKGISGSPVVTEIHGQIIPVAMVLRINPDTGVLRTLRFDYIKEQFNRIKAKEEGSPIAQTTSEGIPYRIEYTSYAPIDGDLGASTLQQTGCWGAMANEGKKTVELILSVNKPGMIDSIEIQQSETCGSGPLHFWLDQRVNDKGNWEYVRAYEQKEKTNSSHRIGLAAPRQLRIRFDARNPVFIQGIRLH